MSETALITYNEALEALRRRDSIGYEISISLDLGLSYEKCKILKEGLYIRGMVIEWHHLEKISEDEKGIYTVEPEPRRLSFYSGGHFYSLVTTGVDHAPTIEVDGIHMHRVKDIYPEEDAAKKVQLLGRLKCKKVLDLCTGLGYTAIQERRMGACKVITVEKDSNILALARINPWSRKLFEDKGIEIVEANAVEYVNETDEVFDAILHDPPTIKLAGELYSGEFYKLLYKILKYRGVLVHYVGLPGRSAGAKIYVGVMKRLREAGFTASFDRVTECVRAVKV